MRGREGPKTPMGYRPPWFGFLFPWAAEGLQVEASGACPRAIVLLFPLPHPTPRVGGREPA